MSEIRINYPNLDKAQELFDLVKENFLDFDWAGADADWAKNINAVRPILSKLDMPFDIVRIDDDIQWSRYALYYIETIKGNRRIGVLLQEDVECSFDFSCPLDVVFLLDSFMRDVEQVKEQFKLLRKTK